MTAEPGSQTLRAAALAIAALAAGCGGPDPKVPTAVAAKAASAPCAEPAGMTYPSPPAALNDVEYGTSPKARRERQNGCAGVRFRIDRLGTVKDAVVVVEAPEGYGFGQATLDGLAQTQFPPAASGPDWYYSVSVYLPKPPPPVRPPPG